MTFAAGRKRAASVLIALCGAAFSPKDPDQPGLQTGHITEFTVNGTIALSSIAAGADGNLWALDVRASKIVRITPVGSLTEFALAAGSYPGAIAAGPDGNVWFVRRGEIGRITPNGQIAAYKLDGLPSSICSGPDGNLWFTESFRGKIGRATTSGQITMFDIPTRPGGGGCSPHSIAAGADGNLWFTESNPGANKVGRISPDGKITEFALPTKGNPTGIASGPDGYIWVLHSSYPLDDRAFQISPNGEIAEFSFSGLQKGMLTTITAGPDGYLWFTESNNPRNKIGRVTTRGQLSEFQVPTQFSGPSGITVGPDGNMWFTEAGKGKIGRLQTAEKDVQYVLYLPSGFVPERVTLKVGQTVEWVNEMPGTSFLKCVAFDSGPTGTGSTYRFTFGVAGVYNYRDEAHPGGKGAITVPMQVSPDSGTKTTAFSVTWAGGAEPVVPAGCVIDVQVLAPGAKEFATWQNGVTAKAASFVPIAGEGVYRFRTRLRNSATGAACDWSPEVSITVR